MLYANFPYKQRTDDVGTITPLLITGFTVSNVTETGATISWTTNHASTSLVRYGVSPFQKDNATSETDVGVPVLNHSVTLSGLTGARTYLFQVQSRYAFDGYPVFAEGLFVTSTPTFILMLEDGSGSILLEDGTRISLE
jgi:hypothetical protein